MRENYFIQYACGWVRRSPAAFLLHIALLVILAGACCTFLTAQHGTITLTREAAENTGISDDGHSPIHLPFAISLQQCSTEYYPASTAARDYRCDLKLAMPDGRDIDTYISMQRMLKESGYRFTLVSMGSDSATLTINHDPAGIPVTYCGYGLLLLSMILYFFDKHTGFRALLRMISKAKPSAICIAAMMATAPAMLAHTPTETNTVPPSVARTFGKIYVYWDDRPAPMQTLTKSLLSQIYGSDNYKGLSADQVALGWLLYYDRWKHEPIIRIKDKKLREALGIESQYASLSDFFDANGYKLQPLLNNGSAADEMHRVDRSVQLLSSLATGALLRIYPYMSANDRMEWLSWTDYKPSQMPIEQWNVISTSMGEVARHIMTGNPEQARNALLSIRRYQLQTLAAANMEPSQLKFRAEIAYNTAASPKWPAIALMALAISAFVCILNKKYSRVTKVAIYATIALAMLWILALIIMRWIIAGHWPMTNGPESMELMALMALAAGLACGRRNLEIAAMGMMVAGVALMVAHISGNAHVISPLLPVLNSPLLSAHVFVIMCAYALLGIIMLISLTILASDRNGAAILPHCYLSQLSLALLYPAVFLLAAGIFIGAIWANQSWGRYWGWDPKETWALITMLIYSVPLHWSRLKWARKPKVLAAYLAVAFLSVLMTYFGVNFFLGGLHSYAS